MRSFKSIMIVFALSLSQMAGDIASAERSSGGGGHQGGYYRGGGYGGHYRGGGYRGHYYRSSVGVVIGGPFWGSPWYYPYSYYPYYPYYYPYYAPVVEVPTEPPVYIERDQSRSSSTPSGVWYYCPDSNTYYPYVKNARAAGRQYLRNHRLSKRGNTMRRT